MWRRLPVVRALTSAPVARRRLVVSRRFFCAATVPLRVGKPAGSSSSANDDFFVDIDSLAGYGDVAEQAGTNSSQSSGVESSARTTASEVLGVVRAVPEDENARYSRLQVPLEGSAEGNGAGAAHVRSNTRAGLDLGEEARYADSDVHVAETTNFAEVEEGGRGPAAVGEAEQPEVRDDDLPVDSADSRLPDPSHLPYDDERFAEMLLEMEVNGVIDETWQDANKAHIEDVKEIADILRSLKVRDICCIDVSEKTSNFDYMMFGTCEGARHIHLAAWAAQDADKVHRISKIKRKQTDELWEVVPIGRIVLNLMVESFREEMTLERKWAVTRTMDPLAAANAPISEGRQVKAHGLWTLTLNLQDLEDFEVDYCKDILMRQM